MNNLVFKRIVPGLNPGQAFWRTCATGESRIQSQVKRSIVYLTYLCLCLFPTLIIAQSPTQQLLHQLASVHTMQASFQQTTTANGETIQQATGNMTLLRPGQFYWRMQGISDQIIIADGKQLWVYDKDLAQVTVQSMQQLPADVPGLLLAGSLDYIGQHYTITLPVQTHDKAITFKLTPKGKQALFQYALLTFDDNVPQRLVIVDQLDQITTLTFTDASINIPIAANTFHFTPPSGVDVIKQQQ